MAQTKPAGFAMAGYGYGSGAGAEKLTREETRARGAECEVFTGTG